MRAFIPFFMLAIIIIICCAEKSENKSDLKADIQSLIQSQDWDIAVAFEDLKTNDSFFLNHKKLMHAASTMKTPVMIEVFKQANKGKFSMDDSLMIRNEFKSIVDSSKYSLSMDEDMNDRVYAHIGQTMTIRELVREMITVSNNLATNILVELVGAQNIMKTMNDIGAHDIRVLRGVEDIKAYRAGLNNVTTAYDLYLVMRAIASRQIVDESSSEEMMKILMEQIYVEKIPALLPDSVKVANKTGHITRIDHDSAILVVNGEPRYIMVVLTKGIVAHNEAKRIISHISKLVYDYHAG